MVAGKPGPQAMAPDQKVGHPQQAWGVPAGNAPNVAPSANKGEKNVAFPAPIETWHEIARKWYISLKNSGQAYFYEPSDVAQAFFLADSMDYYLNMEKRSAQMLMAITAAMDSLLTTVAARRRNNIELTREVSKVTTAGENALANAQWLLTQPPARAA